MQKMFSLKTSSGKNDSFVFPRHFVTSNCSSVTCKHRYAERIQTRNKMFTPYFSLSKPTGYVLHQQFNIQELYARSIFYVFCIYLRTNSDLCHLQHKLIGFITEMKSVYCAVRTGSLNKAVCASSVKG